MEIEYLPGALSEYGYPISVNPQPSHIVDRLAPYLPENSLVLDVGSGTGPNAHYLATRGHDVVALEYSEVAIENRSKVARHLGLTSLSRVNDVRADLNDLPFNNQSFDAVISSISLQFIEHESQRLQVLSELQRITKEGGLLAIHAYIASEQDAPKWPKVAYRPGEISNNLALKGWNILFSPMDKLTPIKMEFDTSSGEIKPFNYSSTSIIAQKPKAIDQRRKEILREAMYFQRSDPELYAMLMDSIS